MKRINIVCITLLMILLGVNTSCADYLDKAPDEDLTLGAQSIRWCGR